MSHATKWPSNCIQVDRYSSTCHRTTFNTSRRLSKPCRRITFKLSLITQLLGSIFHRLVSRITSREIRRSRKCPIRTSNKRERSICIRMTITLPRFGKCNTRSSRSNQNRNVKWSSIATTTTNMTKSNNRVATQIASTTDIFRVVVTCSPNRSRCTDFHRRDNYHTLPLLQDALRAIIERMRRRLQWTSLNCLRHQRLCPQMLPPRQRWSPFRRSRQRHQQKL